MPPNPSNPSNPLPELMSPAGDWDALRAAVMNGADAVYFGLDRFNARRRAANFQIDELPRVMEFLHGRNVKGYLTFNVLIFSDELSGVVEYAKAIAAARVDAVIVQDLGLALLLKTLAPALHVHGSTQMTLTEPRGIEFVGRELGVRRVVLARELSTSDIATIVKTTDIPVEVFIHGALCVAYSGQCLTSEALGGRSANRGQCAQACRLPYELIVDGVRKDLGDKAYLLSPQDLAAHDLVDDLVRAGVACFKIEGRLKSAQYVAAATQTYRQALDAAIDHRPFAIGDDAKRHLAQVFSRGFTHGFLDGVDHSELVPALFPKSRGIRIGVVVKTTRRGAIVQLDAVSTNGRMRLDPGVRPLKPGDGIVFDQGDPAQDEQGGRIYEIFPVIRGGAGVPPVDRGVSRSSPNSGFDPATTHLGAGRSGSGPLTLELTFAVGAIDLKSLSAGDIVWKTDDPEIRKRLEQSYARDQVVRSTPVDAVIIARAGENLRLTLTDADGRCGAAESAQPLELARRHPAALESIREQLERLGDTPFKLRHLRADVLDAVMIPKSVLNELRRRAVDALIQSRGAAAEIAVADPDALDHLRAQAAAPAPPDPAPPEPAIAVLVRSLDQLIGVTRWRRSIGLSGVYCDFEDVRKYHDAVPIARAAGLTVALATTRIIKPGEEGLLRLVAAANPDGILARNLAATEFFRRERPDLDLYGDYSLNVANELTAGIFLRHGLQRLVPSYDLNWSQMSAMLGHIPPGYFEAVVHQHMPMFHMEHCVFCHTLSTGKDYRDCGRPCDRHRVDLKDRQGQPHALIADVGCRNTLYNAAAQSALEFIPRMLAAGLRHFRIELLRESGDEVGPLLTRYADVIAGRERPEATLRTLRVLNRLGVGAGTLERE